jgi:GDPmannose 4,6-dehydratase
VAVQRPHVDRDGECSVGGHERPARYRRYPARTVVAVLGRGRRRRCEELVVPRAFVTGITGQDGQHLAEFLHGQGYDVYGMVKGQNNPRIAALHEEMPFIETVSGDLADLPSLVAALEMAQPDEVYNLGAISFVALSFSQAELTANITGLGVLRMLEAIRMVGGTNDNPIRFYQASSSEMFGKVRETPQTERTPFHPRSPYGCAKVFGHDIVVNYRESYGLYACSGILFNHEGPRRGLEFVTRKVTNAVARIKLGLQHELVLGTMDTKRDWGFAGDYVKAMWLMLQQDQPDDYVISTGETHTVRELVERAFAEVGIDDWDRYVRQDPKFMRPAEVDLLIGDAAKARTKLGWEPEVDFATLVKMMVDHDLRLEAAKAGLPVPA